MPRVKSTIRPVKKGIHLPEDLVAKVDLRLYSELEGKVPFAAWSTLVEKLLATWLSNVEAAERAAGGVKS